MRIADLQRTRRWNETRGDSAGAIERDGFEFYVPEAVEDGFGAQKDLVVGKTQDVDAFTDLMITMKDASAVQRP